MLLLNFAHPLTDEQLWKIEALTGEEVERVLTIDSRIDPERPLVPQIVAMVERVGLSPEKWQTLPTLINPPNLNFSAVALIAELHGHMGYFPRFCGSSPHWATCRRTLRWPRSSTSKQSGTRPARGEDYGRRCDSK